MKPSNEEGVPRLLRWIISDVGNTIDKDLNDAMKKMQPGWVKAYTDEERLLLDEYRRQKQENSIDAVKEKLLISDMQRKELDEKYSLKLRRMRRLKRMRRMSTRDDGEEHKEDDEIEEEEDEEEEQDEEEHKEDDEIEEDEEEHNEDGDMHDHNDDGDGDDIDNEGSKGGDMHDHENEKEGNKGGDDEHGTESKRNEVPSETPEKQSTPSPKTNEANEEEDGKDGTNQGVESETGNKPSSLMPKEVEIPEGQEEHMNLNDQDTAQTDEIDKVAGCEAANKQSTSMPKTSVINEDKQDQVNLDDQNVMDGTRTAEIDEATIIAAEAICQLDPKEVLLLTQGEESQNETYTSIEDLLDNLSETVFVKLEKSCYRTTPSEVKEKMATLIRHDCPIFALLSQEDPKEESSQK
ncbi:cilia- and flagella-associated protein 251-like [Papaver somniferum]|uniref:cilia- and flagella-associated protein 251-like n=1 Tax=Papaver somniferum TaxID=3469 RepID=UPI000E6FB882|nr:cilia- and flagella-associated protein 251-like [Papaver somniferum]